MSQHSLKLNTADRIATDKRSRTVSGAVWEENYQRTSEAHVGVLPGQVRAFLQTAAPAREMNVVGSAGTPVLFDFAPASSDSYRVDLITFVMVLSAAPELTQFGNLAALANGCLLQKVKTTSGAEAVLEELAGGYPIKDNNDLLQWADPNYIAFTGSRSLRFSFAPRIPIRLSGGNDEALRFTVQDDLSTLTQFRASVEASKESALA